MAIGDWLFDEETNPSTAGGDQSKDFSPGGDNRGFLDDRFGGSDTASNSGTDVFNNVGKVILAHLRDTADVLGENPIIFEQLYEQHENSFWTDVDQDLFQGNVVGAGGGFVNAPQKRSVDPMWYLEDPKGFKVLLGYARNWWGAKIGPGVAEAWSTGSMNSGSGSRGSGSGRTLPTDKQIRQQYDLNQLGRRASDLWRSYLLEEPGDARSIAKSYVDEIVKSRGEKKIDFDAFVEQKIEGTTRYANIMKNKPGGMKADQYLQSYYQTAMQVLRPENAEDAAIGGAQMASDPNTFQQRLKRSREFRTSAPFMESLEGRLRGVKGVLKG